MVRGTITKNPYHQMCTGKQGIWLSRLRMGLSALNSHRYKYNFINSPTCTLCNEESETVFHFFINCPTHQIARQTFFNHLQTNLGIDTDNPHNLLPVLLEGHYVNPRLHAEILSCIYIFLQDTGSFN